LTTPGTLKERLTIGITPVIQPRADAVIALEKKKCLMAQLDVEMRLVDNLENHSDIVSSNNHL
jgi:hypothetical protein